MFCSNTVLFIIQCYLVGCMPACQPAGGPLNCSWQVYCLRVGKKCRPVTLTTHMICVFGWQRLSGLRIVAIENLLRRCKSVFVFGKPIIISACDGDGCVKPHSFLFMIKSQLSCDLPLSGLVLYYIIIPTDTMQYYINKVESLFSWQQSLQMRAAGASTLQLETHP